MRYGVVVGHPDGNAHNAGGVAGDQARYLINPCNGEAHLVITLVLAKRHNL